MHDRFGRLEKVQVRRGWSDEARDFTPWLAENLDRLSDELGVELSVVKREHRVGRYSLDLMLEDSQGRVTVVENQFGSTDHDHLGKLLTYASGTEADIVIWIAERFNDEHLSAIAWLNENTLPGKGFFAIELQLLRIGQSPLAPHFRVLAKPNEWQKQVRTETRARTEWDWAAYESELAIPQERLTLARDLVTRIERRVGELDLPWQTRFTKSYIAVQRPGGYNVLTVVVLSVAQVTIRVKLPASLTDLGEEDPYPDLQSNWIPSDSEYGWKIPSVKDAETGLNRLIDLAARYQPTQGPLPAVTHPSAEPIEVRSRH